MTRSRHRPPQRRDESPAVQWSPGAPTQFWLRRTNVWRRATSPRTGAKRLRSGQIDQVRSFERRFGLSGHATGLAVMQADISATRGKKAHFCDRHHIASATAGRASLSSTGTACAVLTFDGSSRTQPRQRRASLRSCVIDWEHSGRPGYPPTNGWVSGDGGGDS